MAATFSEVELRAALRRAFSLGQTYWQQADSESYHQNAKSDDTLAAFNTLVSETQTAFADSLKARGASS
jgi:hypothetical protein